MLDLTGGTVSKKAKPKQATKGEQKGKYGVNLACKNSTGERIKDLHIAMADTGGEHPTVVVTPLDAHGNPDPGATGGTKTSVAGKAPDTSVCDMDVDIPNGESFSVELINGTKEPKGDWTIGITPTDANGFDII